MDKIRNKEGITLIALIITIIVMLILVAVTINMAVNGGLFGYASNAAKQTKTAMKDEQNLGDYIEDLLEGPNGAYVGNTKMTSKIWIPDIDEDNFYKNLDNNDGHLYCYNIQGEKISPYDLFSMNEDKLCDFFTWCYDENDSELQGKTIPSYNEALEIAGLLGINKEIVRWANNNKGSRVRNVQAPFIDIEPTGPNSADIYLPITLEIIDTNDKNFYLEINIDMPTSVSIESDAETGDLRLVFGDAMVNPESISFCWINENGPFNDVELPFGMKLKYKENPYKPEEFEDYYYESNGDLYDWELDTRTHYNDLNSYCEAYAAMYNRNKRNKCVIEWQGQEFNCNELRKYLIDNFKIQLNDYEWNYSDNSSSGMRTFMEKITNIKYSDLIYYFRKMIGELIQN